jgi:hypothetical protein
LSGEFDILEGGTGGGVGDGQITHQLLDRPIGETGIGAQRG